MNTIIVFGARYLFVIVPIAALWTWWRLPKAERLHFAVQALVAGMIGLILAKIGGHFIESTRPYLARHLAPLIPASTDNGFPSDHTLLAATLALLTFTKRRPLGAILMLMSLCVGVARVLALVHSPVDVAGALGIALVATLLSLPVSARIRKAPVKPQ